MEYTQLGSTGTRVSEICFGTWRFGMKSGDVLETDRSLAHDLLDTFWEGGGNYIDTANVYGTTSGTSEEYIGDWLTDHDREDFVIASKVYFPFDEDNPNGRGLSRTHIRNQIEGTLDRLGTDYLDVYYIHRWDENTPISETLQALNGLVEEGKVNYLGASTMAAWQLTKALWTSDVEGLERFEVTQPMYHAAYQEVDNYLDVCADQDLAVCPYSPLAGGFLTGKYERDDDGHAVGPDGSRADLVGYFQDEYVSETSWRVVDTIESIANDIDASPAQVALRYLMDIERFQCIPIVGARTVGQMKENLSATDVSLSADHRNRIAAAREGSDI
ncbi:aldo/keto reductase [Haloferax sp. DFSO52]|uniref:aldo/keto reductase n=1 Tax=Haloferax sp. DFSO52 TaxID=3388505 RepID=UPI003A887ADF